MKVKEHLDEMGRPNSVSFFCPGCKLYHRLYTTRTPSKILGPRWRFNGDMDKPTLNPSILAKGILTDKPEPDDFDPKGICHSFVREGRIEFLNDCTHELKGKTVEIPDYPSGI